MQSVHERLEGACVSSILNVIQTRKICQATDLNPNIERELIFIQGLW